MKPLRYGIVGGGFISAFQLKALRQVRGVEVAGLVSRRPPEQLAAYVREHGLGEGRILRQHQGDGPARRRDRHLRPELRPRGDGRRDRRRRQSRAPQLKGVICEKPLGRNLAEARRAGRAGRRRQAAARLLRKPTAHEVDPGPSRAASRRSSRRWARRCWPARPRSTPARTIPGSGIPMRQGGGVMSDMGCHCLAVGWYALTPPGKSPTFLSRKA